MTECSMLVPELKYAFSGVLFVAVLSELALVMYKHSRVGSLSMCFKNIFLLMPLLILLSFLTAASDNRYYVNITSLVDPEVLAKAKMGAADSLWYKDHGDVELIDVIIRTAGGESVFPGTSPSVDLKDMFFDEITPRQINILRRFVKGMTYDEIAADLKLSKNGVRWNLDQIVAKGGFKNKHELLAAVIENKFIVTTLDE